MKPDGDHALKIALAAYAQHLRHEVGYPEGEATLMLTAFAVGWKAHENAMLMVVRQTE